MQQEFLFDYDHSKDKPEHVIADITFIVIAGLAISFITYLIIAIVVQHFFSQNVPLIVGVFIFIAFVLFMRLDTLKHGVTRISISNQEIHWETSQGQNYSLNNNEIYKVIWQHNKLLFNQETELDISALSFKYNILLNSALSKLFPENILIFEGLESIQFGQTHHKDPPNLKIEEPPIFLETGRKSRTFLYITGAIFLAILLIPTLQVFKVGFQKDTNLIILLDIFILIAYVTTWILSTYHAISISNEGILCQKANKSHFFEWHKIEAIEIHIRSSRRDLSWKISVWEDNEYMSISFGKSQKSAEKIGELHDAIIVSSLINNIPFGIDKNL